MLPQTQTTLKDDQPGATFREIRKFMAEAYEDAPIPSPWTDREFEEYAMQEPLPPNRSFMLPAEEQPTNDPNQLHLNYHEH